VDFQTVNGTAIAGGQGTDPADYGHSSGSLVIPKGQSYGTIEVTIMGDRIVEGDEYFFVTLSNPVNAMIVDDTAIASIIDSGHGHGSVGEGETLLGTAGDDVITTRGGADSIDGLAGNDTLIAGGGPDTVHGGEGDDLIVGLGGPDKLYGEAGDDEIVGHGGRDEIEGGTGDDIIYAGGAPDIVDGGPGDDFINAEGGPDQVQGGEGDDVIYGGGGPDTLQGGGGDDVIRGEGGPDLLDGGAGSDQLYGGGGPDQLMGGTGADILKGGSAGDIFKFENLDGEVDRIVDFSQHDQIDISAILDIEQGDPISDYVRLDQSSSEATSFELSVNPSGSGDDFELVVILENMQSDPDLDQLISNGNLVVVE
jgi:Ca2+-binding RTX toxin-like protein